MTNRAFSLAWPLIPDGFVLVSSVIDFNADSACGVCGRETFGPWWLHIETRQVLCDACISDWPFDADPDEL
jgi:hypothetical protein